MLFVAPGRKDGGPPTVKRTGKDAVEGADPLLGLGVLFFLVRHIATVAETKPETKRLRRACCDALACAVLLLGLGLLLFKA